MAGETREDRAESRQRSPDGSFPADADGDRDEPSEVDELRRENARLRRRYDSLRRGQYRKTAVALAGLGMASLVGAVLFPPVRDVLVVLGAIGLFAAVVTRYLTPEQFIPVEVGATVFEAHAANHAAIVDELGLQDNAVYAPDPEREAVRLFVPEHRAYTLPEPVDLRETFVVTDDETQRGVAFDPSGAGLFAEFERSRDGPLGETPATLARQSTDALVELFELVESATAETDAEDGRLTVSVGECRFGAAATFDTPVASFLSVTVARGLDTPVTTEVTPVDDGDFAVTCRWEPDEVEPSKEDKRANDVERPSDSASDETAV
ncbi:hypothetical protein [Halobellus ordinarius]|uniref:hypothetical protein n=1 Tax=Halobellus ordinarius TaxID=3075120 RepID=UPI002880369D|nr:hypothetical protein [Halobellus sp. ZY16]